MRAGSAFASGTRHVVGMTLQALLVVAIAAALVFTAAVATRGEPVGALEVHAARLTATISFGDAARVGTVSSGTTMNFSVTRSVPDNDPLIWVSHKCYNASGKLMSWVDLGVAWGTDTSLKGNAGPFEATGTRCEAYVTLRPAQGRVLGDAIIRYDVSN